MDAEKLVRMVNGMLCFTKNIQKKEGDFTREFLENVKTVIEEQQKEIERLKAADEKLQIIADRWVAIETNGTPEDANDFYTFVQDTLSSEES